MNVSEEKAMAFADGQLDEAEAAAVAAEARANPALAAMIARRQAAAQALRAAFAPVLDEPVPERLLAAATHMPDAMRPTAQIIAFPRARAAWIAGAAAALAASLALGVFIGRGSPQAQSQTLLAEADGALLARGALAQALQTSPSGEPSEGVRVLLSFADDRGAPCRAFAADGRMGLACADAGEWRLAALVETPRAGGDDGYRPAAAPPEALLAAIDARIAGEAFTAEEEATAIAQGWSR